MLNINALACYKANIYIEPMLENINFSYTVHNPGITIFTF